MHALLTICSVFHVTYGDEHDELVSIYRISKTNMVIAPNEIGGRCKLIIWMVIVIARRATCGGLLRLGVRPCFGSVPCIHVQRRAAHTHERVPGQALERLVED
jgi:hypothetical protein